MDPDKNLTQLRDWFETESLWESQGVVSSGLPGDFFFFLNNS